MRIAESQLHGIMRARVVEQVRVDVPTAQMCEHTNVKQMETKMLDKHAGANSAPQ